MKDARPPQVPEAMTSPSGWRTYRLGTVSGAGSASAPGSTSGSASPPGSAAAPVGRPARPSGRRRRWFDARLGLRLDRTPSGCRVRRGRRARTPRRPARRRRHRPRRRRSRPAPRPTAPASRRARCTVERRRTTYESSSWQAGRPRRRQPRWRPRSERRAAAAGAAGCPARGRRGAAAPAPRLPARARPGPARRARRRAGHDQPDEMPSASVSSTARRDRLSARVTTSLTASRRGGRATG